MKLNTLIPLLSLAFLVGCGAAKTTEQAASTAADAFTKPKPEITEAELHAPFYPGAEMNVGDSMVVKTPRETSILAKFSTKDAPDKVKAFYESKVSGLKFNSFNGADAQTMMAESKASDGGKLAFTIMKKPTSDTTITIGYGKY